MHEPQCAGSLVIRTQSPEQFVVPVPHVAPHVPAEQTCPLAHARGAAVVEHAPQLALSALVFTSHPLAAMPSQSAKPVAHVPSAQVPAVQVAVAFANTHRLPQPPQLFRSVPRTLVSQPVLAIASQSADPAAHAPIAHAPAMHACVATPASMHALGQLPQWAGSVDVATQLPPQLVRPVPHDAAHMPVEQTCPAAHALPHIPQLPTSLCRSRHSPVQTVCDIGHETVQSPERHTLPLGHAAPQPPQFALSVCRSAHRPAQLVCPITQDGPLSVTASIETSVDTSGLDGVPVQLVAVSSAIGSRDLSQWRVMVRTSYSGMRSHSSSVSPNAGADCGRPEGVSDPGRCQ